MKARPAKHLLLFLLASGGGFLSFLSCTRPSANLEKLLGDSLEYITRTHYSSREDCLPDSQGCSFIKHQYPEFGNLPEGPFKKAVHAWLSANFFGKKPDERGIDSLHALFLECHDKVDTNQVWNRLDWREEHYGRVLSQNSLWICLEYRERYFIRNQFATFHVSQITLDKKTGRQWTIGDFFQPAQLKTLTALVESEFRKIKKLKPDQSLYQAGFAFSGDTFSLPPNFSFSGNSIRFLFDEGALSSADPTYLEIEIANYQMKPLLRPGSFPDPE